VFPSCSALRAAVSSTPTGYARPIQETGPNPALLSFPFGLSLRCLIWLSIPRSAEKAKSYPAACFRYVFQSGSGCDPKSADLYTTTSTRTIVPVKYLSGVFPSRRGEFPIFSPFTPHAPLSSV